MMFAHHDTLLIIAAIVLAVSVGTLIFCLLVLQRSSLGNLYIQMEIVKLMSDVPVQQEAGRERARMVRGYGLKRSRRVSLPARPLVTKN